MTRPLYLALTAAFAATLSSSPTLAKGKADTLAVNLPELVTWELGNGLRVAYVGVHKAPVVSVQLWYRAGAKDEPRNRRGVARMFEQLMFKGSTHLRPDEHTGMIADLGGNTSAFTTEDATGFHNTLPKEHLDFAVRLEAERMRNLLFREATVDAEREVVKAELRKLATDPLKRGVWQFLAAAYTKHPYAWEAGGRIDELDKTSVTDLKQFYDSYYVPNNALLIVVGDVSEVEVRSAAEKWFGKIPRAAAPPRPAAKAEEPAQKQLRRQVVAGGQIGLVIAGFHIPEAKHPDIYALQVLSLILGVGDSSRLSKRLVRADKVARQTGCSALVREDPGLFVVFGAYDSPAQSDALEAGLRSEIARVRTGKVSNKELRKAKNVVLSSFVFGLEGVGGLANQIGTSWILTGDPKQFMADIAQFEAVDAAAVKKVANTYLVEDNLTIVVVPPQGGGR